jgi:hypothetical protein
MTPGGPDWRSERAPLIEPFLADTERAIRDRAPDCPDEDREIYMRWLSQLASDWATQDPGVRRGSCIVWGRPDPRTLEQVRDDLDRIDRAIGVPGAIIDRVLASVKARR